MESLGYTIQLRTLRDHKVLLVGGGSIAAQKIESLLLAGAKVHVVAPSVHGLEPYLARVSNVSLREFLPGDVAGAAVVIAATDIRAVNLSVAKAARRLGILVNAADDPELCDFYLPAVVRRDDATITVGTDGRSPLLAARLRRVLDALLPASLGDVGALFVELRRRGLKGLARRDRLLAALADPGVGRLVEWGDREAALDRVRRIATTSDESFEAGSVVIVGAGPGDPSLLTVRARDRIHRADVVLHDALVTPEILEEVLPGTSVVAVGRRARQHGGAPEPFPQEKTSALMIKQARAGCRVVRLHGGDPLVFGRGGEEIDALRAAGVKYELVPGVSAVLAAPAEAGIPLTKRSVARAFTVRTGHGMDGPTDGRVPVEDETAVFLMALSNVAQVMAGLVRDGRSPDTPAVAVSCATRADRKVVRGTIATLARLVEEEQLAAPATLIVGEVARHAEAAVQIAEAAA